MVQVPFQYLACGVAGKLQSTPVRGIDDFVPGAAHDDRVAARNEQARGARQHRRAGSGDASNFYNSGLDNRWVPIASDVTTTSVSVNTALLVGSNKARVKVRATDGVNTTEAISAGALIVPAHPPIVFILDSRPGKSVSSQGAPLTGVAYDARDGVLPATSLEWVSDRDGALGSGGRITKPLSIGAHVITLTATDSQGRVGTATRKIVVK